MTTLEGSPQDINSRLAAIEATVPRLAAKSDAANMAAKDDIAVLNAKVEAMNAKIVELRIDIIKRADFAYYVVCRRFAGFYGHARFYADAADVCDS